MSTSSSQRPSIHRVKSPLSKSTMQFFQNKSTLDNFMNQFFLPKQHDYNQNILQFYSATHNFVQKQHDIPNSEGQKLYASLFYKSKLANLPQTCIVYCHGFGSTRLEAVHILKVLKEDFALCCFDFSGAGKSEGDIVTYGAKEKQDIRIVFLLFILDSVIKYLKRMLGFKRFILWGRSMGATACLLYSIKYEQSEDMKDQNVMFQIVDSPFVSFQKISLEMAKKFISMPEFGTSIVLDLMRKNCDSLKQYNPFSVSLQNVSSCKIPTLFVYSQNDDIVCCKNSEELCSKFSGFYEKMIITQNHNSPRSSQTLSEIMKKIEIQLKKCQLSRKNGVLFRSFIFSKSNKSKSNKKGIQRSLRKQQSKIDQQQTVSSNWNRNAEYGIQIASKCQTPNPHSTSNDFFKMRENSTNSKVTTPKVGSYSTLPHEYNFQNYQSPFVNHQIQTPQPHIIEYQTSPKMHHIYEMQKSPQIYQTNQYNPQYQVTQNIYQMKKPQILKSNNHTKQIKRLSSPLNSPRKQYPEAAFAKEQIFNENLKEIKYRQSSRRNSANKKLNISLSKFKDSKVLGSLMNSERQTEKIYDSQKTPFMQSKKIGKREQKKREFNFFEQKDTQKTQSSPYITMKQAIGPINVFAQKKSPYQTTTITKASSMSSSMDNLHFLGAPMLGPNNPKNNSNQNTPRKNIFDGNVKINLKPSDDVRQGRVVKKIRSSDLVYFDKNVYKNRF